MTEELELLWGAIPVLDYHARDPCLYLRAVSRGDHNRPA
jgi:hypothetical protein